MKFTDTRIVYLTAGAGGMYCGSCMHDNALAKSLMADGWDVMLVPFYTPIRTDEESVTVDQVFFGGINVWLQQKVPLLRKLPGFIDRILDRPGVIRAVTSRSMNTDPKQLGSLALSVLKGIDGNQRKEVRRVNRWLTDDARPDLLVISNILIAGFVPEFKRQHSAPVLVTLQGDDVFLDQLPERFREKCIRRIREIARSVDGFIVHSHFFRDYMADYFGLDPETIHVTPLGLDMTDFTSLLARDHIANRSGTQIGYLARLAPEKGLHHLVDAFIELKQLPKTDAYQLKIAGWMNEQDKAWAESQWERLRQAGLGKDFHYAGVVDRPQKLKFLKEVDLLCVPTGQQEPKGLFVLEALAAGTPVVQPAHGCFPEVLDATGGGVLFEPRNRTALTNALMKMLTNHSAREAFSAKGQQSVHARFNQREMAKVTGALFRQFLSTGASP